jgi:hypothetical protein
MPSGRVEETTPLLKRSLLNPFKMDRRDLDIIRKIRLGEKSIFTTVICQYNNEVIRVDFHL